MKNKKVKKLIQRLITEFNPEVTCCWWSRGVLVAQVRTPEDDEFGFDDVRFKQGVASLTANQLKEIK